MSLTALLMAGLGSPGVGTQYDLSFLSSGGYEDTNPTSGSYAVGVAFQTDGQVDILRTQNADSLDVGTYADPSSTDLYVRAVYVSGAALSGLTAGTWYQTNSARNFQVAYTAGSPPDTTTGTYYFELATDSGGTNVVATSANIPLLAGSLFS